jgi:predicted aspartyl protease
VVPVLINGKVPTYFLIDSGASSTVLSKRTAEELGRIHLNSAVRVHGLSGQVPQVWTAPPIEMNVLGIGQRHQKVLAIDLDFHAAESGVGLDGMLGFSFLQHLVLTLDDRNGLVKLEIGRVTRNPALRRSIFSPL